MSFEVIVDRPGVLVNAPQNTPQSVAGFPSLSKIAEISRTRVKATVETPAAKLFRHSEKFLQRNEPLLTPITEMKRDVPRVAITLQFSSSLLDASFIEPVFSIMRPAMMEAKRSPEIPSEKLRILILPIDAPIAATKEMNTIGFCIR